MFDLVIRSDRVVTPQGAGAWEIAVQGEKIVAVAAPGTLRDIPCAHTIDAIGKTVMPGGIDPHVHCHWPTPAGVLSAPPAHVSRAALFGGTTTMIDFALRRPGQSLRQAIELRDADWREQCCCDYAYHVLIHGEIPPQIIEEMPEMIRAGFPTIKMYTTDGRPSRPDWKLNFGDIWEVLQVLGRHGGLACIHSEDDDLVMHMYRKLTSQGSVEFTRMAEVHSVLSEDISFRRIIRLAENVERSALYLMHVSARAGVEAVAESRSKGYPVYGETLHHYAYFTNEDYQRPNGQVYHTYPSLKGKDDHAALWNGITATGAISTVATDGVCTPLAIKTKNNRIDDTVGGNVGVEPRVGVIYTEMVAKRGCSIEQYVDVVSSNAAKIMGLYPRKGAIAPGSDADLTILDPQAKHRITAATLHESDYTPWEGYDVAAWPTTVILRGKVAVEKGEFYGSPKDGRRLERRIADSILDGPAV